MVQETYHKFPSLERLNVLVGEWNLEFIFPNDPIIICTGGKISSG